MSETYDTEKEMQQEEALSLEESFALLEDVITDLERSDISLEDSFKAYKKGMRLIGNCAKTIDRVEKKMLLINESGEYSEF